MTWIVFLLMLAPAPTHAASFFYDNVRIVRYQPYVQQEQQSRSTCLYRNRSGECMIEQYLHASPRYNTYAPRYSRDYLFYERRNNGRDDDDDYYSDDDDDYYYDDDDDYGAIDDDDDYYSDDDDDD